MSDLISRQGAINKCRTRLYESAVNNVGYNCDADKVFVDIAENRIETWLNELPSAQAEIVRCKDCKHYNGEDRDICCPLADYAQSKCGADWFCADAERRTDE